MVELYLKEIQENVHVQCWQTCKLQGLRSFVHHPSYPAISEHLLLLSIMCRYSSQHLIEMWVTAHTVHCHPGLVIKPFLEEVILLKLLDGQLLRVRAVSTRAFLLFRSFLSFSRGFVPLMPLGACLRGGAVQLPCYKLFVIHASSMLQRGWFINPSLAMKSNMNYNEILQRCSKTWRPNLIYFHIIYVRYQYQTLSLFMQLVTHLS